MRLLVFGLGYCASRFLGLCGRRFARLTATQRSPDGSATGAPDLRRVPFDGRVASTELVVAAREATHVLVSIPPDDTGDPVLRAMGEALAASPDLSWIGYLSTVGVYGDFGGGWVDETTAIRPGATRNQRRAEVEKAWMAFGRRCGRPVQVFRLAGIYGPGRNAIENLINGTARRIVKPGQVFNRVHVDDIVGAVAAGMARPDVGPVVNVADDLPAPAEEVVCYAAMLLGIEPPAAVDFHEAAFSPMGRSFYGENKRVSNRLLRQDLGYRLLYPTYREGLRACLATAPGSGN